LNDALEHSHLPDEVARRIAAAPQHSYLADFVYGAIDGTVTTFAVVSGVAGAGLPAEVIVVLGLANLAGDGFSMAASNYLGTKTNAQLLEKARQMERRHIVLEPDGEREEVRQIYARKGFEGQLLEHIVDGITSNEQQWVNTMLTEELGLRLTTPSAIRAAIVTFIAFLFVGFIPLFSFVWQLMSSFPVELAYAWSTGLTAIAFFGVGAAKSRFVEQKWYVSGFETLLVGGTAAGLAYGIGSLLQSIVSG
jgi:VIT1/CCC1 family predicted Fe2+/Mn2+ transporter